MSNNYIAKESLKMSKSSACSRDEISRVGDDCGCHLPSGHNNRYTWTAVIINYWNWMTRHCKSRGRYRCLFIRFDWVKRWFCTRRFAPLKSLFRHVLLGLTVLAVLTLVHDILQSNLPLFYCYSFTM
jgi:hypothetical protein